MKFGRCIGFVQRMSITKASYIISRNINLLFRDFNLAKYLRDNKTLN